VNTTSAGPGCLTRHVARCAVRSLYAELTLYPKPGLVSLVDNGSHADMDASTFMRSLFALRHYFARICRAGFDDLPFSNLKLLAIEAEARMLRATGGINTHRGAIFCLGLVCAAAGRATAQGMAVAPGPLRTVLLISWGAELAAHGAVASEDSNGLRAARLHGAGGAREEGAQGLPSVFDVGLPALRRTLAQGRSMRHARIDALYALMAQASDTNVYHRGGAEGARIVREHALRFIEAGGTADGQWQERAIESHRVFCAQRLSPGGAADLLAAACLVHALDTRATG
jgi:triphosphoribosyl-dephospho-CoA synthase